MLLFKKKDQRALIQLTLQAPRKAVLSEISNAAHTTAGQEGLEN